MGLEFYQDAICLSGLTGSKIKCQILGEYYPFWWNITSGGESNKYKWPTTIVALDAATGEAYIKETNEIILGSSGHALHYQTTHCPIPKDRLFLEEVELMPFGLGAGIDNYQWPAGISPLIFGRIALGRGAQGVTRPGNRAWAVFDIIEGIICLFLAYCARIKMWCVLLFKRHILSKPRQMSFMKGHIQCPVLWLAPEDSEWLWREVECH